MLRKERKFSVQKKSLLMISKTLSNQELSEFSVKKSKNLLMKKLKISVLILWTMLSKISKLKFKATEMLDTKKLSITLIMSREKEEKDSKFWLNKAFLPNKKKINNLNKSRKTQKHSIKNNILWKQKCKRWWLIWSLKSNNKLKN